MLDLTELVLKLLSLLKSKFHIYFLVGVGQGSEKIVFDLKLTLRRKSNTSNQKPKVLNILDMKVKSLIQLLLSITAVIYGVQLILVVH